MSTHTQHELADYIQVKYPKKYKVFILNDDYTAMEFVVSILKSIFHKSMHEAENIMLEVHKKDRGLCGVYTHEIAETKVMQVMRQAKESGFPLKATMEEE
ncbi:MAG: ATP-dependent Clp protease adaptor ClpS [Sulfurimonas sp.]|nr:ATP-dependent Clp protease adaptor ClpS [Sulfurimonas sp.]MDQ7061522.1 ATP-dependent Clp protease adaptor ClpS [Sulfurimonas sp.]